MKKFLFLTLLVILISCGKKGDPEYKQTNNYKFSQNLTL